MSNVRGRIAVDVQFTDSTTSAGVQSLKTITLQDATEYTTGKVAIVTGTCGTAGVTIENATLTYRDSSGAIVNFADGDGVIRRFAFSAVGKLAFAENQIGARLYSTSGRVNVNDAAEMYGGDAFSVRTVGTSGTASYTLVIYGT